MSKAESIQDAVLGYTSKESRGDKLEAGHHEVSITEWKITNSRIQWDGNEKTHLPLFQDPTPQLGIMFRNAEGDVGWHRFNVYGYKRWDDLSDAQQKSGDYEKQKFGQQVYACKQTKAGLVRQKDSKRTAGAQSFIDQFMASVGRTGETVGAAMPSVKDNKETFMVTLEDEEYDGDSSVRVAGFNKEKALVEGDFN